MHTHRVLCNNLQGISTLSGEQKAVFPYDNTSSKEKRAAEVSLVIGQVSKQV